MIREIKLTDDGSSTLYVPGLDEHYHSTHGAVQESEHVFINAGLMQVKKQEINIYEVGFGTGLNALLTFFEAKKLNLTINYYSIEKYPLSVAEYHQLNHSSVISDQQNATELIHDSDWNTSHPIAPHFNLTKIEADALVYDFDHLPFFDLIYFDAFGPDKQPEMWHVDHFARLFAHSNNNAILVTYSAKGETRRSLQKAGFLTERLPGPPGKREMLRAKKSS